ncbi:hypothetical protein PENSTE_c002G02333 [Penicillium steckii]|uniref:WSC domain-containing protein n=1 Tax=Penicillium steckii TaxID=303698 RepID=A0A1V6TSI3_9EURO|nr:hypothetical protein PENSTE_c002G02333 [Penicillium steckii]
MHSQQLLAVLAFALPAFAGSRAWNNLGCYSSVPSLTSQSKYEYMSGGYCANKCSSEGYRVAALTGGSKCACGNEQPSKSAKVDSDKCDSLCTGFPGDKCGGDNVFTVLTTDSSSDADSDSDSDSNSIASYSPASSTTSAATMTGGIVVAPTNIDESNIPTGILTAPASMVSKAASSSVAMAKVTSAPGISTSSSSSTPSTTPNAADALRAGPVAGVMLAGLGLLL